MAQVVFIPGDLFKFRPDNPHDVVYRHGGMAIAYGLVLRDVAALVFLGPGGRTGYRIKRQTIPLNALPLDDMEKQIMPYELKVGAQAVMVATP